MRYYPLLLNVAGLRVLVVGAGEVGCRKLADVLESDVSEVLVLDFAPPSPQLVALMADVRVRVERRAFTEDDLAGVGLVFAATGNAEINASIVAACAVRGILCNSADAPDTGGFIVPARVRSGRITLTVSTQGGSPALARRLRASLATFAEPYAALAELLARVRPLVLALGDDSGHNRELFRTLAFSPLGEALSEARATGDAARCESLLRELLPPELHPNIAELLHELV